MLRIITTFYIISVVKGFHIVFLTHHNEVLRSTGTQSLVKRVLPPSSTSTLIWRGRNDNERVEEDINLISSVKKLSPVLVWADQQQLNPSMKQSGSLYIVLDGTFQEAEKMRRYLGILRYSKL